MRPTVSMTNDHTALNPQFSSWGDDDGFEEYLSNPVAPLSRKKSNNSYQSCHATHKPLPIVVDGVTYEIYGGSCIHPLVHDMDIFVGLDYGMSRTSRQFPWHKGTEFLFSISDMHAPDNVEEFKQFIEYLATALKDHKKVFVGCIGGHGRTGTVFSALVAHMTGMADATVYVRENYCKKAVESIEQILFLNKYYGVTKVQPTKGNLGHILQGNKDAKKSYSQITSSGFVKAADTVTPVRVEGQIHGKNKIIAST